jgi:5-methylcytosine-specific restriction endonuclease McrA
MDDGRFKKNMIPWNKGLKGVQIAWNKGIKNSTGIGHSIPHSEETKRKCSKATKERWENGFFDNRIIDYKLIAYKAINRNKKGKFISCIVCDDEFYIHPSEFNRNPRYCSKECQSKDMVGEKAPRWNGGNPVRPYIHIRNRKYKDWRYLVFKRDNFLCQDCGNNKKYLHAHHIKSFAKFPDLRYELSNGLTLCIKCHKEYHRMRGY